MVSSRVSPLARRRLVDVEIDHVSRQAFGGDLEGGAGARRILEEQVEDALAAQQWDFFDITRRNFHKGSSGVENLRQDTLRQALDREQVDQFAILVQLRVMHFPASRRVDRARCAPVPDSGIAQGHIPDTIGRRDRQLAPAPVGQYRQLDGGRTAIVEQFIDRGTGRSPGVEHVVDQNQVTAFDVERDDRRPALRMQAFFGEVVAIEGDVDQTDIFRQAQQFLEALGDPGATTKYADQGRITVQAGADQLGQLATLRLGIGQGREGQISLG
jgi:hypothetical protein